MIRRSLVGMLLTVLVVFSISTATFARGAPDQDTYAPKAAVVETVSPMVVNVTVDVSYDATLNRMTTLGEILSTRSQSGDVVTTANRGQSTTGLKRTAKQASGVNTTRSAPLLVLLT